MMLTPYIFFFWQNNIFKVEIKFSEFHSTEAVSTVLTPENAYRKADSLRRGENWISY